jgi:formylmethanofuran dehydrogenase subunit B
MNAASAIEANGDARVIEDAICLACGCICDDIAVEVVSGQIIGAGHACQIGKSWFSSHSERDREPCLIEGVPASVEDGIDRAAGILTSAAYPIVHGLSETTTEAQRLAVAIADWVGGCVDTTTGADGAASILAFQEVGQSTCTLGEIKSRADLIIVWRANPTESHPRHFERYSLFSAGEFLPNGRGDRFCVVVDDHDTATASDADLLIQIKAGADFEALWVLRALAKGVDLEPSEVEDQTGVSLADWQSLMDRMKRAKYGAILSGKPQAALARITYQALLSLVRDMNAFARFVSIPLGSAGNRAGAENVLAWRTGYPCAVNLARGYPRYGPGEFTAEEILGSGEADAALIIGDDLAASSGPRVRERLRSIPAIVLAPNDTLLTEAATVVFHVAVSGIHSGGTVYRVDGVAIRLRPALESRLPSVEEILTRIERAVRRLSSAGCS